MASVCSLGAGLAIVFPDTTSRLVEPLPLSRHGHDYWVFLGVTATLAIIFWYVVAKYLLSSPADDAKMFADMVAKGKPMPAKFNPALLDESDPAYNVVTWRYALARRRSR